MGRISRQRIRAAARQDGAAVAKLAEVQERQIKALQAQLAAAEAVLVGSVWLWAMRDVVLADGQVVQPDAWRWQVALDEVLDELGK